MEERIQSLVTFTSVSKNLQSHLSIQRQERRNRKKLRAVTLTTGHFYYLNSGTELSEKANKDQKP